MGQVAEQNSDDFFSKIWEFAPNSRKCLDNIVARAKPWSIAGQDTLNIKEVKKPFTNLSSLSKYGALETYENYTQPNFANL